MTLFPQAKFGTTYPGVKAVLDNAITPLNERAEQGVRPNPDNQGVSQGMIVDVRPARLATTNITNWKFEQQEDPVVYQAVKHWKAPKETFREALLCEIQGPADYEERPPLLAVQIRTDRGDSASICCPSSPQECSSRWVPSRGSPSRPEPLRIAHVRMILVARHGS